jgi:hypothetical protein
MAKVAIFEEGNPRRWKQFDEDTEVLIEYLPRPDAIELNTQVDKLTARTGGNRQNIWGREIGKRCVHGWRNVDQEKKAEHSGLVMPNGEQIPYNEANRDKMMKFCREFSIFVNENAIDAQVFLEIEQQKAEKVAAKED